MENFKISHRNHDPKVLQEPSIKNLYYNHTFFRRD